MRETFSRKLRQCKWNVASLMKCSILEKRYFETGAEESANRLTIFLFIFSIIRLFLVKVTGKEGKREGDRRRYTRNKNTNKDNFSTVK